MQNSKCLRSRSSSRRRSLPIYIPHILSSAFVITWRAEITCESHSKVQLLLRTVSDPVYQLPHVGGVHVPPPPPQSTQERGDAVTGDLLPMSLKGEDSLEELSHPFYIGWNILRNISERGGDSLNSRAAVWTCSPFTYWSQTRPSLYNREFGS